MKTATNLAQVLARVAECTTAYPYKVWGFGEAIAMMGLLAASQATSDGRYRACVASLFERWRAARSGELAFIDHVTPGVPLLHLARDEAGWMPAALALGRLHTTFPRQAGVPVHRPDLDPWRSHVWVDCLYTDGAFLALLARVTGDPTWEALACDQAEAYVRVLWDESSGLFVHGYEAATGRANAVHWGRGNGWALLGILDLLRVLRREHPAWDRLAASIGNQINALMALQDGSGHWHTVLDHPDTYFETSVAAMMAYAFPSAARLGLAGPAVSEAGDRAFAAALGALDHSGALTGVSEATPAGEVNTYATRPTGVFPWGQGPMLLAIADRLTPDGVWEGLV